MDIFFLDMVLVQPPAESAEAAAYLHAWRPPGWIGLRTSAPFHSELLSLTGETGALNLTGGERRRS